MKKQTFDTNNTNNYPKLLTYILQFLNTLNSKIKSLESGGGSTGNDLNAVLTAGNTSPDKNIELGGNQKTGYFKSFINELFGTFRSTTIFPNLIVFENQINRTRLTGSTGENTEVTLQLPNEDGILATQQYVESFQPYKIYTDLISQTGTSDPTGVNLENTTGGTVTYNYIGPGEYEGACIGFTIPEGKFVPIPFVSNMDDLVISMERLTDTMFRITTTTLSTRVATNDSVYGIQPLSFKVYNEVVIPPGNGGPGQELPSEGREM